MGGRIKTNTREFGSHLRRWLEPSRARVYATGCSAELLLQLHPQKQLRAVPEPGIPLASPFFPPACCSCSPHRAGPLFDQVKISNPSGLKSSRHQTQTGQGDQSVQGEDERGRVSPPFVKWRDQYRVSTGIKEPAGRRGKLPGKEEAGGG